MRDLPGGKVLAFFMFKTTQYISPEEIQKVAWNTVHALSRVQLGVFYIR